MLKRFLLATDFALGALQSVDKPFRLSFALEALFGFLVPLLLGLRQTILSLRQRICLRIRACLQLLKLVEQRSLADLLLTGDRSKPRSIATSHRERRKCRRPCLGTPAPRLIRHTRAAAHGSLPPRMTNGPHPTRRRAIHAVPTDAVRKTPRTCATKAYFFHFSENLSSNRNAQSF